MRDWIENHYLDRILSILSKELREVRSVVIDIASIDLTDNKDSAKDKENKIGGFRRQSYCFGYCFAVLCFCPAPP